jgi:biotin transport system substrate-specific component
MTILTQSLSRDRRLTAVGIIGFAVALAAASQISIPLPGTPVPLTLQPFIVVLAGLWLGPVAGAASMALYIAAGLAGAPVFSPTLPTVGLARLLGPTGGYILAWPVAAFVTGWLGGGATFLRRALAATLGSMIILVGGLAQLSVLQGSVAAAVALGVNPFVLLDVVKAVGAAALAPSRGSRDAV